MKARLQDALAQLPGAQGERFRRVLAHGSMSVEIYAPQGTDPQQPHAQDELYFIVSGRGMFHSGGERHPVGPGDCLFVPAGREHRFEEFSNDFVTWVVFWGPPGGEGAIA
ncbi:cupin domain-containing protein [Schlegelella sp. S2-27]|uniref:Cupin domain-containing protein n=1 Tax=Caldimonas mangrovi TaxID=2944811 RepID=A0ABT0YUB8_9BURK|nr:cupin domain-containing protein [Caldimonas mangrovi]MCM5681676.1 cupin domain-containing protein [Caldimonas mangrovi]